MTTSRFEAKGRWWDPASDAHKVPGILTFSPEAGAELTLLESLTGMMDGAERTSSEGLTTLSLTEEALDRSGRYARLHGEAGGALFTLEDCIRVSSSNAFLRGMGTETIRPNQVIRGALFEHGEALEATGVSFGLQYLSQWLEESGISMEMAWRQDREPLDDDTPRFKLEGREKEDRLVVLGDGAAVALKHRIGTSGDSLSARSITQEFQWRVDAPGKVPFNDLIDVASDIQDLVSIAINRTSAFDYMRFWHPDVFRQHGEGERMPEAIDLFVRWNAEPEDEPAPVHPYDLLFSFAQLGGIAGVGRWLDAARQHRSALGRVMATRYAKDMFVSDRVLNCAAALESFDRSCTGFKNTHFKTRLERCASLAGSPFENLVGDIDTWAEAVRWDRDDIAHHYGRRPRDDVGPQYYLWLSLYFLFVLCMLRASRAPEDVFKRVMEHRQYRWLIPRIGASI
jgi:hypothetical protein